MEKNSLSSKPSLIMIGGSAGSFEVLIDIVTELNASMYIPIVIIVHKKSGADNLMVELLNSKTAMHVKEAEDKERIATGTIYLAPADYHLLIEKEGYFSLDASEKINYSRPSIDVSFHSAAEVFGSQLVCILLSGANADGVEGLKAVEAMGGVTVVQDPATAEVPYMPMQAMRLVNITHVVQQKALGNFINELVY